MKEEKRGEGELPEEEGERRRGAWPEAVAGIPDEKKENRGREEE